MLIFKKIKIFSSQNNKKHKFRNNILALTIALLIAIVFRSLFYQAFVIPSSSMEPNLLVGDYLFVSKYDYGYSRFSFPLGLWGIGGETRVFYKPPKRGDVIVFKNPSKPSEDFVKRVIGLPNDKVQIIGGIVYLNNKALKYEVRGTEERDGKVYTLLNETLPEGKTYKIYKDYNVYSHANNTPPFFIKEGHFFVMGDNRDYSMDSRFPEIGQIPKDNLVGKAQIIFFSIDGNFLQFWRWNKIRFNRIFNNIH